MALPALIPLAAAAGPALTAARVGAARAGPMIGRGIQALFDRPSAPAGFQDAVQETVVERAGQAFPGAKAAVENVKKAITGQGGRRAAPRTKRGKIVAAMQARPAPAAPQLAQAPSGPADVPFAQARMLDERVAAQQGVQAIPTTPKGAAQRKRSRLPGPMLAGL